MKTELFCYAKLNLTLSVTEILPNGYHGMIMHDVSVGVYDRITVYGAESIVCTMDGAAVGEENTAYRAARLCVEHFQLKGLGVEITKGIPFGAGMGGSSADAAGVFVAVSRMYGVTVPTSLALKVGADVPYMMTGGFCRVEGIGERVLPQSTAFSGYALIAQAERVSTAKAFAAFDSKPIFTSCVPNLFALPVCDWHLVQPQNALYRGVAECYPAVRDALCDLQKGKPLFSGMTGSGGAVFALFSSREEALKARDALQGRYLFVSVAPIVESGIEFC